MWNERWIAIYKQVNDEWRDELERRYFNAFTELFGIIARLEDELDQLKKSQPLLVVERCCSTCGTPATSALCGMCGVATGFPHWTPKR